MCVKITQQNLVASWTGVQSTKDNFEPLYVSKDHTTKPNGLYITMDRCLEDKKYF
jgi:hypothetical protein